MRQWQGTMAEQAAVITQHATTSRTTIASLQANATEQAAAITRLQVDATDVAGPNLEICGTITITSDAEFNMMAPHTQNCVAMSNLFIRGGGGNATQLAAAFANLRMMMGRFEITNNPNITTLHGTFPQLQTVAGAVQIDLNPNLEGLDNEMKRFRSWSG